MPSYWEKKQFFYHRHLIICGAGFTGLSAAVYYKRKFPERSVLVIEKDAINGGASTKNAGFACFGSPSELLADLEHSPENEVFNLVEKRWKGLRNLRSLLGDEAIGFEQNYGFELFKKDDPLFNDCMDKLEYLNQQLSIIMGKSVYKIADEKISRFGFNRIEHIIENIEEGQVDTGKMFNSLLTLAKESGIDIFNGITIKQYEEGNSLKIETDHGMITCDQFLIANNGFASNILQDSETIPARAQVLITSVIKDLQIKGTFHMDEGFYYFRNIDGRVLFGGGRNTDFETENTTNLELNPLIQQHLEKLLHEIVLPNQNFQIEQRWAGVMGMGKEKQVIVRKLSERTFCAIRLSGMGLALSTLIGKQVVEMME